jgi:hypothetical protein
MLRPRRGDTQARNQADPSAAGQAPVAREFPCRPPPGAAARRGRRAPRGTQEFATAPRPPRAPPRPRPRRRLIARAAGRPLQLGGQDGERVPPDVRRHHVIVRAQKRHPPRQRFEEDHPHRGRAGRGVASAIARVARRRYLASTQTPVRRECAASHPVPGVPPTGRARRDLLIFFRGAQPDALGPGLCPRRYPSREDAPNLQDARLACPRATVRRFRNSGQSGPARASAAPADGTTSFRPCAGSCRP